MRLPQTVRIGSETLLAEVISLALGWLVYQFFRLFSDGSWPLLLVVAVSILPALVYLAMRNDRSPGSPPLALDVMAGFLRGIIVSAGLVFTAWVENYSNPCPPEAFECGDYLGTILAAGFSILVVLPAFIILTPVYGLIMRKKQRDAG